MRRRYGTASKVRNCTVRGLRPEQVDAVATLVRENIRTVCNTYENIPFIDFLDMMYTPEEKDLWMRNYEMWGTSWAIGKEAPVSNAVLAVEGAKGTGFMLRYRRVGALKSHRAWQLNVPQMNSRERIFRPIKDFPEDQHRPDLFAQYGRHIVRCHREFLAVNMAWTATHHLLTHANCAREIKQHFPELIDWMPESSSSTEYFRKTKHNKFSSKYKPEKLSLELPPKWEQYKEIIKSMVIRGKLMETIGTPDDPINQTPEDAPIEKWWVRVAFCP